MNKLKQFARTQPHWAAAFLIMLILSFYWLFIATDRYVSRANIVIDSPQVNMTSMNLGSLISGGAAGSGDLLLLRDHLLSTDMMNKLQRELNIREHYADSSIDRWARLSAADAPMETFHKYMQKRLTIDYDDYAGVLRVEAQAYTPEMAQRITEVLLAEGEAHMNAMGQRLAMEQVRFIEQQVNELEERLFVARDNLIEFQNTHGLVSPSGTVEAIFTTVAELEAQIAIMRARDRALADSQAARSSERVRIRSEIEALEQQAAEERQKMARLEGDALNRLSAEYETLELRAQFAVEMYSQTLAALETTRVEAARTLKQISVLQYPSMPEYSTEPRRVYNITVIWIFGMFLAAIAQLIRSIIRDHKS
ncbi:MAG: chain-length determining protein [Firmicutes bacterium]|nr:chain-length determining protein [Bacillota bacterium]